MQQHTYLPTYLPIYYIHLISARFGYFWFLKSSVLYKQQNIVKFCQMSLHFYTFFVIRHLEATSKEELCKFQSFNYPKESHEVFSHRKVVISFFIFLSIIE